MNIQDAASRLKESKEFQDWKTTHPKAFLMNIFAMFEIDHDDAWLVNYYDPKAKMATTFMVDELEVLQEKDSVAEGDIKALDMSKLQVEMGDALETAQVALREKTQENTNKTIVIVQNHNGKEIWNISYMTVNYNIFNAKIDAETGKLIEQSIGHMFRQA